MGSLPWADQRIAPKILDDASLRHPVLRPVSEAIRHLLFDRSWAAAEHEPTSR